MRTVTLKSVYEAIMRRHGLDPRQNDQSDTARAIAERITSRARRAWRYWDWPELQLTEERAYRTTWTVTRQFRIVGENGKPDELFYMPNATTDSLADAGYYRVKLSAPGDPPVGTLPTNATYFEALTPLDRFIAYDQLGKRSIGDVLGVYGGNPRVTCPTPLYYRPSEKGIDVCYSGLTVFVKQRLNPEKYSLTPYVVGKVYAVGDLVYYLGDCYVSLVGGNTQLPTNTSYWSLAPFPEILAEYVKAGAYADGLKESDPTDTSPDRAAVRRAMAKDAEQEAEDALIAEIDPILMQGQRFYYTPNPRAMIGCWCWSPPYTNGTGGTTTLRDVDDTGAFSPAVPSPGIIWEYHPEITALTGSDLSLSALKTTSWAIGSMIELVIGGQAQRWQLKSGVADVNDPGQVAPNDFNVNTNQKYWQRVT